ncbi:MAG: 2Fe-2S iron-sulfur cluster binding domain-containing protein [Lewinellaceae bacterium]|nr:2Fe-2S iron-sulfur cluster binding domain-containing protein [Lewinellaceae bacterium]
MWTNSTFALQSENRINRTNRINQTVATIKFQFEDKSIPEKTVTGDFLDQSILELTEEYDIHLNHNCGGVCACSTCHVYVESGEAFLEDISDKEEDFIDRAVNPRVESRLGCQCVILDNAAEIVVTIPDQSWIIGHEH